MTEEKLIKSIKKAEKEIAEELKLALMKRLFDDCAREKKGPVISNIDITPCDWWKSEISS